MALDELQGGKTLSFNQVRQIQDADGISIQYDKGRILFRNGIDKLKFLIGNREMVSKAIGVTTQNIWRFRRNLGKMNEYLAKVDGRFQLGDSNSIMQMYISKHDENIETLDSQLDWTDYILT